MIINIEDRRILIATSVVAAGKLTVMRLFVGAVTIPPTGGITVLGKLAIILNVRIQEVKTLLSKSRRTAFFENILKWILY